MIGYDGLTTVKHLKISNTTQVSYCIRWEITNDIKICHELLSTADMKWHSHTWAVSNLSLLLIKKDQFYVQFTFKIKYKKY